jgi:hypothetical protein
VKSLASELPDFVDTNLTLPLPACRVRFSDCIDLSLLPARVIHLPREDATISAEMATPSATASKTTAQNASTPQSYPHLNPFSSPAPRSVPSPAAVRSQGIAGKSPFNHASASQQSGGASNGANHPTVGSTASVPSKLGQNSPAGIIPGFDSPGMMLPSLSNMGFGEGGVGMGIHLSRMSELQMGTSMGGRGGDEERRKRLDSVVGLLKSCPSRLSPEGLEILGQRQGLACLLDPTEGFRKNGTRECHLAAPGETFGIEVKFLRNNVVGVDLTIPDSSAAVESYLKSAAGSLRSNLSLSSIDSPMVRSLNKFTRNLERLAKLDKLNSAANSPNFNCFEAITGVYTSLKKLFDHEKKVALALIEASKTNRDQRAEREVLSKKSGRPQMNARDNIGLTLDYWMDRRQVFQKPLDNKPSENGHLMDVDTTVDDASDSDHQRLYSLNIECESMTPGEYIPIRVSDAWISDQVEKPSEHPDDVFGPVIDWQEPPPTFLTSSDANAMSLDSTTNDVGKTPNIRFVARLDPPLGLPSQIAANILASTAARQPESYDGLYHNLILDVRHTDPTALYGSTEDDLRNTRYISCSNRDGRNVREKHVNILHLKSTVLGNVLHEIPFSHPKQVIQILPVCSKHRHVSAC